MFPLFLTIALLYALFILWLWRGVLRLEPLVPSTSRPFVSVIVAAPKEAQNLPGLLDSLRIQSYPADRLELIVVDDGSTDDTYSILSHHTTRMTNLVPLQVTEVPAGWSPKKWALTTAIKAARGEIIVATDADCLPGSRWVETMAGCFDDATVGLVMGPAPVMASWLGRWYEALFLDSISLDALAAGGASNGLSLTCTGRNLAYRKQAFEDVGGFSGVEHLVSGDDDLLLHKIAGAGWGIRFALALSATVPSPPPVGWRAFLHQRLRHASKGRTYYSIPTSALFKVLLPLIYMANVGVLFSLVMLATTLQWYWLAIPVVKLAAEAQLVYTYLARVPGQVRPGTFLLTGLIHPLYVTVFGLLGNFYNVGWKSRRYSGTQVSGSR